MTENPIGYCHCDGELWVSQGCLFGFSCDATLGYGPNGGEYIDCEPVSLTFFYSDLNSIDLFARERL